MSPVESKEFECGFRYVNGVFIPYNELMAEECRKNFEEGEYIAFVAPKFTKEKTRTFLQNKSMHLWFAKVAEWLNDNGLTMVFVISMMKRSTLRWTPEAVKEVIWRNIQRSLFGIESTTKLSTKQVTEIHKNAELFFCERLKGVPPAWPDIFNQSFDSDKNPYE